jgi:hypothetical protein
MEVIAFVPLVLLFWFLMRAGARDEKRALFHDKERASLESARRARYPEPTYGLSENPNLAELEVDAIANHVVPWDQFRVSEKHALQPYLAAGPDLTDELREAIIETERAEAYLSAIDDAKASALWKYEEAMVAKRHLAAFAADLELPNAKRTAGPN